MLSGFSQEILAEKAELHPNYLGRVERGEEHISLISLRRIAEGHRAARATIADVKITSGGTGRVRGIWFTECLCIGIVFGRGQDMAMDKSRSWSVHGLATATDRTRTDQGLGLYAVMDWTWSWPSCGHGQSRTGHGHIAVTVSSGTDRGHVCGQVANVDCARTRTNCGRGHGLDADADWTRTRPAGWTMARIFRDHTATTSRTSEP
jgi:hypothetical protein